MRKTTFAGSSLAALFVQTLCCLHSTLNVSKGACCLCHNALPLWWLKTCAREKVLQTLRLLRFLFGVTLGPLDFFIVCFWCVCLFVCMFVSSIVCVSLLDCLHVCVIVQMTSQRFFWTGHFDCFVLQWPFLTMIPGSCAWLRKMARTYERLWVSARNRDFLPGRTKCH